MERLLGFDPRNAHRTSLDIPFDQPPTEMPDVPTNRMVVCEVTDWERASCARFRITDLRDLQHAWEEYFRWPNQAQEGVFYCCDAADARQPQRMAA